MTAALKAEPNLIRARWELAQLAIEEGQPEEAKRIYQEILAAVPGHPKTTTALAALERPHDAPDAAKTDKDAPDADSPAAAPAPDADEGDSPPPKKVRHRRRP